MTIPDAFWLKRLLTPMRVAILASVGILSLLSAILGIVLYVKIHRCRFDMEIGRRSDT